MSPQQDFFELFDLVCFLTIFLRIFLANLLKKVIFDVGIRAISLPPSVSEGNDGWF